MAVQALTFDVYGTVVDWRDSVLTELAEFGDARLKTLSTGMRSRLAFSAMRHVETGIYLMDEVMSAGDRTFNAKCEAVFEGFRLSPKTFVVATHDLEFVQKFCTTALWLHKGKLMAFGESGSVVEQYISSNPRIHTN